MQYRLLGKTGITVSRLCFGTLTIGPLQAGLSTGEGSRLICQALDKGVNFIDTAEIYGTYPHIRQALRHRQTRPVLATKSYAYTRSDMKESLNVALTEMDVPKIDVFLLHEQESALTLAGHRDALEYLLEARQEGLVGAVGISCHTVAAVRAAAQVPEIDVVHPLVNMSGTGIRDGTLLEMLEALSALHKQGAGIYGMKPLGGGHLISQNVKALEFVLDLPQLDAVAVGMMTSEEVEYNCSLFSGGGRKDLQAERLRRRKRQLFVHDWCAGCGECVVHCPEQALALHGEKVAADPDKCILCGYCGAYCPDFCLKIF